MIHASNHGEQVSPTRNPALQEALKILAESQDIDHLEICFSTDGRADLYPRTNNPERLYRRLRWLTKLLRRRPELLRHAAGACQGCQGRHDYDAR
jgi:hypothetical protein